MKTRINTPLTMAQKVPLNKSKPAWLALDSAGGKLLIGANDVGDNGLIPPGNATMITAHPQISFKGERLFVKKDCASDFLIRDVFVGPRITGKVSSVPIAAEFFAADLEALPGWEATKDGDRVVLKLTVDAKAADLLGQPWPTPTCQPGIAVTFSVENVGNEPRRFLGALLGQAVWWPS